MTKEEFYLRAMLQLAANPKYVEMQKSEEEEGVEFPELLVDVIEMDADELLRTAEANWPEAFDNKPSESVEECLCDIRNSLNGNLSVIVEEA